MCARQMRSMSNVARNSLICITRQGRLNQFTCAAVASDEGSRGKRKTHDTLSETVRHSPLVVLPVVRRIARVTPQKIVQEPVVGDVCRPLDPPDVVHRRERGRQTAVDAEDLGRDDRSDGEGVEDVDCTKGRDGRNERVLPASRLISNQSFGTGTKRHVLKPFQILMLHRRLHSS